MLWDRGEGAGYVQHITADPYPGTPVKTVLLDVAYGDHQVTPLSALIAARALGATIHRPLAADGRWAEVEPGLGPGDHRVPVHRFGNHHLGLGHGGNAVREPRPTSR